jgi:hypothetical protein
LVPNKAALDLRLNFQGGTNGMPKGKIKKWNEDRGFGFITPERWQIY